MAAGGAAILAACTPEGVKASPTPIASSAATTSATPSKTAGASTFAKLEGPTIVTDPSKFPTTLKEAPELAALVQQGKLPPVAQRVGQDPLVIQPAHEVGKYGGTLNRVVVGGLDDLSISRFMTGPTGLLLWDYEWKTVKPNIARSYTVSPDNTTFTVQLRRGMRWSDGAPFNADDIIFWFEDLLGNQEVHPGLKPDVSINGKPVIAKKIDDTTVQFVAPESFPLFLEILATPGTSLGNIRNPQRIQAGPYAPKHYLSQFHAKYVGKDQADKLATAANQTGWVANIKNKLNYKSNPDLPTIYPWIAKNSASDPSVWLLERNPYSIWVDTAGNQLPYIGTVRHTNVQSPDVMLLKTTAGEIDFMDLQYSVQQLPVLLQNQDKGKYVVYKDPEEAGVGIFVNIGYDADPIIGDLFRNVDFRRALSMGIDRAQLNETFWLGTGTPSSAAPVSNNKYFPGEEWRTKWATLDVAQANQLLDKIGLTNKDSGGFRTRKDGKRLTLSFMSFEEDIDMAQFAEMVKTHWQKIGVDLAIDKVSVDLATQRTDANTAQVTFSNAITDDPYFNTGMQAPISHATGQILGVPFEDWWRSGGTKGKEPPAEIKQAITLWQQLATATTIEQRIKVGQDLTKLCVDNVVTIGVVCGGLGHGIRIAKSNMGNVPVRFVNTNVLFSPVHAMAQTYYYK